MPHVPPRGPQSLASRVRLALGVVAGLMASVSLALLLVAHRSAEGARQLYSRRVLPMGQLEDAAEAYAVTLTRILREVRSGQLAPGPGQLRVREVRAAGDRAWEAHARAAELPDRALWVEADRRLVQLRARSFDLERLLATGPSPELGIFGDRVWTPEVAAFMEALEPLRAAQRTAAAAAVAEVERRQARFAWGGLALVGLGLALAWAFGQALARRFTAGAEGLVRRLETLAGGDLEPRPVDEGPDEWGRASRALEATAGRLRALMAAGQAQQALQQALLDGAQAAVIGIDSEGRVNQFNRQAEVMLGYRAEEVLGQSSLLWRLPEELQAMADQLGRHLGRPVAPGLEALQAAAEVEGFVQECHYRRKDGGLVPVALGISQVRTPEGQLLGTMGVAMDLRPIRRLEGALKAVEDQYRQLVDRVPGVVLQIRHGAEGRVTLPFVGSHLKDLLGLSAEAAQADPERLFRLIPSEDAALFLHLVSEATRTESPFQWEGRMVRPDGEVRWVHGRANPSPLPGGGTQWDALLEDQTSLMEAERALAVSEQRWQLALAANRDGIWDENRETGQVWFSPRWKEMLGYRDEELPNLPETFEARVHPEDLPAVRAALAAFQEQRSPAYSATFRMRHRDGGWRWILSRGAAVRDGAGRVVRMVGSHADITEQRQSEQALRESEARAQAASRAKSSFLANMSHELRTPLSAILGYTRLLARDDQRSAEERTQLHHILEAGEHLLELINDVLSLSKIEAGRLELKPIIFPPRALFSTMEGLFGLSMQSKGLSFRVSAVGFPPRVEGDEAKLRQVLVNLLGNALKFTETGGVTLEARWQQGRCWFTISDTGPGIAEEDRVRIFQAFSQTEQGVAAGGTGLGLHLSQALVRLMGGEIGLASTPGEGSRFTFELPLPEAAEGEGEDLEPGLVTGLVETHRAPLVLVVDDRLENRDILQRLLQRVGLRVRVAEDGGRALARWATERPDLVLMDLRMPGMDGFVAAGAIRGQEGQRGLPRTPVVAISASVYDVSLEELKAHGFDDFLVKPIEEARLFACLEAFLGIHFVRKAAEPAPASPEAGLAGLAATPGPWREAFRALVAVGDLDAAEARLAELADPDLREALRRRLRAYQIQELLSLLG